MRTVFSKVTIDFEFVGLMKLPAAIYVNQPNTCKRQADWIIV